MSSSFTSFSSSLPSSAAPSSALLRLLALSVNLLLISVASLACLRSSYSPIWNWSTLSRPLCPSNSCGSKIIDPCSLTDPFLIYFSVLSVSRSAVMSKIWTRPWLALARGTTRVHWSGILCPDLSGDGVYSLSPSELSSLSREKKDLIDVCRLFIIVPLI